jgi:hypothetical protein
MVLTFGIPAWFLEHLREIEHLGRDRRGSAGALLVHGDARCRPKVSGTGRALPDADLQDRSLI